MVTKFKYYIDEKQNVKREAEYSFTPVEDIDEKIAGMDNEAVVDSIIKTTLKGEKERKLIDLEDSWFGIQKSIQDMQAEKKSLEKKLESGDSNDNPLTPHKQSVIKMRIAELSEGTIEVEKEFYDHYTRKTHKVKEAQQTPFTIALEKRTDIESENPYLKGFRGVDVKEQRPTPEMSKEKETKIRKELVRQKIYINVGDEKDLIADLSNAFNAFIKRSNGETISNEEEKSIEKYLNRQKTIDVIMNSDYNK